jgi:transcriptional regulator with GAF, ATPase, and Fis domain
MCPSFHLFRTSPAASQTGSVLRLPLELKPTVTQRSENVSTTLADADREHILETLNQTNWMIGGQAGAANRLGLPRTTLI